MNIRTIATLAIAVALGLLAVLLVRNYLGTAHRSGANSGAVAGMTPVVVAAAPVTRGMALVSTQLKVVNYPADAVPDGAFHSAAELGAGATGRIAMRAFAANEPILLSAVTGPGGKLTLSGVVAAGMRAVSIHSSDVAGVAGFVLPGDRVDVLLTRTVPGADPTNNSVTQVLAQNVLILGVDQLADNSADKPVVAHVVTVEATPEQAQQITLAQSQGNVSFTLRHVADDAKFDKPVTTVADLAVPLRRAGPMRGARSQGRPGPPADLGQVHVTRGTETAGYSVAKL